MKKYFLFCVTLGIMLIPLSCTTSSVITKSPGNYSITSSVIVFQTVGGKKEVVYSKANDFCESKGKVVKTINLETRPVVVGKPGEVTLDFTCVEENNKNNK